VRTVSDPQKVFDLLAETNLHLGETAAIVLAEELGVDQLLLDDRKARLVAKSRNLPVIGTIGTLLLTKDEGLIPSIKEILDNLRSRSVAQPFAQRGAAMPKVNASVQNFTRKCWQRRRSRKTSLSCTGRVHS